MRVRRVHILPILFTALFLQQNGSLGAPQASTEVADTPEPVHLFFDEDNISAEERLSNKLRGYLEDLEQIEKHKKSDDHFLKRMFFKTHRKYLRHYAPSATFRKTLSTGTYGCVSGTALYAIILKHFGYEFEIMEMPSHVYLKVHLPDKTLLIESTLPHNGYISDVSKIAKATQQYVDKSRINNSILAIGGIEEEEVSNVLYARSINLTQLSGLQYYNMAIYNLEDRAFELAFVNAQRASELYPSKRTQKLMEIVINKILQNKTLTKDQKTGILNTYISQVKKKKLTQR